MTTLEEILHGDIRKLNLAIEGLETQLKETSDKDVKLSIDAKITAKTGLLTIEKQRLLFLEQQGNFSSRSSIALFPIFSMSSFAQSPSTLSFFFNFQFFMGTGPHPHESYRMT